MMSKSLIGQKIFIKSEEFPGWYIPLEWDRTTGDVKVKWDDGVISEVNENFVLESDEWIDKSEIAKLYL